MKNLLLIFTVLYMSSCAFTPTYRAVKVDYCERINGIIYCDDGTRVDTNYYPGCSVYDFRDCEEDR